MSLKTRDRNEQALFSGSWVKLICGASNQDLPAIADLCAIFAAAGVHCVDVAAEVAVVHAAREGLSWAQNHYGLTPWLMISVSDGADIHFRKAWFDSSWCPAECSRPCEHVCPALAITNVGVDASRCYGCGRCLPCCPYGLIEEQDYRTSPYDLVPLLHELRPDAIEIHTSPGRADAFSRFLHHLTKHGSPPLRRLAVSCGLGADSLKASDLAWELWHRHSLLRQHGYLPIWQLDGRPMSGDIGSGTARAAVELWRNLRSIAPPGPLQLSGGTNISTVGLLPRGSSPAGVAFGGAARRLLQPWLEQTREMGISLRNWPEGCRSALYEVRRLVQPWLDRGRS